jgi:hypothetical protein
MFNQHTSRADFEEIRRTFETEQKNAIMVPQTAESDSGKVFLPRRPGEPRFGPRQYFYPASKTGVVPGANRL